MVNPKVKSIRWRMMGLVAGVPFIILVPFLLTFLYRYTNAYRESFWEKAAIVGNHIQYMLDDFQMTTFDEKNTHRIHKLFVDYVRASQQEGEPTFEFIALVDEKGYVIAHTNPEQAGLADQNLLDLDLAVIYRRRNVNDPDNDVWVTQRQLVNGLHYLVIRPIALVNTVHPSYYLVIAENAKMVDPPLLPMLISAGAIIVVVILLMQLFLKRTILRPLKSLAEGAAVIGAGDLDYRIDVQRKDELGFVAYSFNNMASQISKLVTSLEEMVKTRTRKLEIRNRQLEAVTLVGQEAVQQRNVTELLNTAVKTISGKFGFYHTAIFILDDEKNWAVLRSASSVGGMRMLNRGHRLRVGEEGMVGNVALTGKPRIALDVGEDAVFFRNPDLQTTRSEMALPLITEEEIIGVLDVQSEDQSAFTNDDINVLQLVANQLAVALSNVRVLETMQTTLEELRNLQIDMGRRGWAKLTQSDQPLAYEYDRAETTPVAPVPVPLDPLEGKTEHRLVMDGETPVVIEALQAGDRVLGYLGLSDSNRVWTKDELSLVHSVGEQIALALENARFFEDSQRNERQQLLINQLLQTASNPDIPPNMILQEIAALLSHGLDLGVVIGVFPVRDLPVFHPYAAVDPKGFALPFLQKDIVLGEEYPDLVQTFTHPAILSMVSFVTQPENSTVGDVDNVSVQQHLEYYHLEHVFCIPMMSGGEEKRFIGLIPYGDNANIDLETRELATDLANQIAVVMDNLNLSEETLQRSKDLRLLYQSSLKLSELLEPSEVHKAIAELGGDLLGADASNLWIYSSETDDLVLAYDHQDGTEKRIGTQIHSGTGLIGQCLKGQKTLVLSDYNSWDNRIPDLLSAQFPAVLAIPLIGRFGSLGVLVCQSRQVSVFGERETSLADLFSAQAAAALENAQLNQEAQRRAEEFSRLYDAGIDLISILDVDELLSRAAEWAYQVLSANRAVLYLRDSATAEILRGQSSGNPQFLLNEESDKETRDVLTGIVIKSRNSILIRDNREYEALRNSKLVEYGLLSLIGVPLQIGDDVIGAMFVNSTQLNYFNDRDIDLLEFLATQVSSALQNSIQFGETERALAVVGRQARYQSNVSQAVAILTERGTDSIQEVLKLLAEAAEAPVALYYDTVETKGSTYWALHSYWIGPDFSANLISDDHYQQVKVDYIPKWLSMLVEQISISAWLEDLPEGVGELLPAYNYDMLMALAVQGAYNYPGFIALLRTGDALWDTQEVVALQTSAAALSNTIARERLFNQVQQTLSETEALYRGSAALNESNTYQSILEVLLNHSVLGQDSADVTLQLFSRMWSESEIPEYAEIVAYWSRDQREHIRERFYIKDFPSSIDIIRKGTPVFVEDVAGDPVLDRRARAMFHKALGAASVILVPLVVGGQRVGYIHATYPERQTFTIKARRQLTSLAQQAAIAVLNIQQLRATEARVRREQLIRKITSRIQESPDVEGVLQTTIRELGRAFSTSRNKIQFQLSKPNTEDLIVPSE